MDDLTLSSYMIENMDKVHITGMYKDGELEDRQEIDQAHKLSGYFDEFVDRLNEGNRQKRRSLVNLRDRQVFGATRLRLINKEISRLDRFNAIDVRDFLVSVHNMLSDDANCKKDQVEYIVYHVHLLMFTADNYRDKKVLDFIYEVTIEDQSRKYILDWYNYFKGRDDLPHFNLTF